MPYSRSLTVERLTIGWSVTPVGMAISVIAKTVRKWRARYRAEGSAGLADRSSRLHRNPTRLSEQAADRIEALRGQRLSSAAIANRPGEPLSTVGVTLRRRGLCRLSAPDPRPIVIRYEREQPREPIHIDIKKLGRNDGVGPQPLHLTLPGFRRPLACLPAQSRLWRVRL